MSTGQPSPVNTDLSIHIGGLRLANPIMPASGTYDWQPDDGHPLDPNLLGAIVTKSITMNPRRGNPPHRIWEAEGAVLNSIGIPSLGYDAYRRKYIARAEHLRTALITSIAGFSASEFAELCALLDEEPRVDAIEVNLSCPNIETDSIFATDPKQMRDIVAATRKSTTKPLIAKLSPNVPHIEPFCEIAEGEGMDAVCIANTFTGMSIDARTQTPVLGNVRGGVTGPGLLPIVLHHVWTAASTSTLPVIACGGVYDADGAIQYLLAGATAVQVGTASFRDPLVMAEVIQGLTDYLLARGHASAQEIIGAARRASAVVATT